jgi:hypothetical protein
VNRREFSNPVRAAIVKRAMNERRLPVCEGCGLVLAAKKYHIDHTIPDALAIDKSRPLTAADGKLLGWDCCHKPKTAIDQGDIAKVKRIELRSLGIKKAGRGFHKPPGTRFDWRTGRYTREAT